MILALLGPNLVCEFHAASTYPEPGTQQDKFAEQVSKAWPVRTLASVL
jgi:hypothetical protein